MLLSQPNLHAADIREGPDCNMPNLCRVIAGDRTHGQYSVAEVVGQMAGESLVDSIKAACLTKGKNATVQEVKLAELPGLENQAKRQEVLADNGKLPEDTLDLVGH